MEFKLDVPINPNLKSYFKEDYETAHKFAELMYKEFGRFIACIAIFGSTAKKEKKKDGDIDILVVVDDLKLNMNQEVVEAYRVITDKTVAKVSTKLHVISLKLTSFWEYIRAGDPVAINILRDGVAMIDNSFFDPLQALLLQGRIRPTPEAIWNYFSRAPATIHNSQWHILQATVDLYWAVVDSAHAALMKIGEIPPSPDHVADLMEQKLLNHKFVTKAHVAIMRDFYALQKKIVHREIKDIAGAEYDEYLKKAKEFVETMNKIVEMK